MKKNNKYIVLVIIAIVLIAVIYFIVKYFNTKNTNFENNVAVVSETSKTNQNIERQNDINDFNQAQELSNLDICSQISDVAYKNSCIQMIALKLMASSSCATISNEDSRSYCSSMIALNKALSSKIISDCFIVEQSMLEKKCIEQLAENSTVNTCETIPNINLKNTCLSLVYYKQAKSGNDFKICNQIPELIQKANCLSEIKNIDLHSDLDHDGLDFLGEILSNTDPNNPDTDGDGYKDGDEVISGYNPDGEGSINSSTPSNIIPCSNIKDEQLRAICGHEFKDNSFDIYKCEEVKDMKLKQYCELEFKAASPTTK